MIIRSEITDCEYEVSTYNGGGGKVGIQHESLHDILVNKLPDIVTYNTKVIAASVDYCAAECVISDLNGRKVQAFNDVSLPNGIFQDDDQRAFVSAHPLTQVIQSSEDTAVREYLGWPRYFMKDGSDATVIGDVEIPPEALTEQSDDDTFTGMNPPEETDSDAQDDKPANEESSKEEETPKDKDSDSVSDSNKNGAETKDEIVPDYTLEELGAMKPPTGKYADKTFDEIWGENPGWFDYIMTTSKNKKFDLARLYFKKKNEKSEN